MKITTRDWVQLSSYLDGEMDPQEKKRLENRIKNDPVLQFALEELRQTKITLGAAPTLKVPRNFTLTPEMVGSRSLPRQVRTFRLAAVLMSFMLVGVLVLDFGRGFVAGAVPPAAQKEMVLDALPESASDALEEPAVLEAERGMESDRAAVDAEPESVQEEEAAAPAAAAVEEGQPLEIAQEAENKTPAEETAGESTNQVEEWQEEDGAEALAAPTQSLGTGFSEPQTTPSAYFPEEGINRAARIDLFRILEIVFALSALSFGTAAWLIRKRKS